MILTCVTWASLVLAIVPALMFIINLFFYRPICATNSFEDKGISVLIPARNEEDNIAIAVESALQNKGVILEVVVMNDHSEDGTREIVSEIAARDPRVRLFNAPPLPEGWCGKPHACAALAKHAQYPLLVFLDADVTLAPAALQGMARFMKSSNADLASGFPEQRLGSLGESMIIPLMHFLLLGFLPMPGMRWCRHPAFAAGCGQLVCVRRAAYDKAGGHTAIWNSMHDGLTLPRTVRKAGFKTDLFDATHLASCRMYRGFNEVWSGLTKNAIEGIAAPGRIVPFTFILIGGQVLPFVLLPLSILGVLPSWVMTMSAPAILAAYLPRLLGIWKFRQSVLGALLHPMGIMVLMGAQWSALISWITGRPAYWKGRSHRVA